MEIISKYLTPRDEPNFRLKEIELRLIAARKLESQSFMYTKSLKSFLRLIGFEPGSIAQLDLKDSKVAKAITALSVSRDFTGSGISEEEVEQLNRILDGVMLAKVG